MSLAFIIELNFFDDSDLNSGNLNWRFCLDARYLMPIAVTEFGSDANILGDYVFTDIQYNTGLKIEDFTLTR